MGQGADSPAMEDVMMEQEIDFWATFPADHVGSLQQDTGRPQPKQLELWIFSFVVKIIKLVSKSRHFTKHSSCRSK